MGKLCSFAHGSRAFLQEFLVPPWAQTLMQTILLVDPETDFLEWAQNQLETPITRVVTSTTADEAYKIYIAENPDLLISETHLMPFSGLELLARVRQRDSNALVILMSAFGTTQSVIESMKLGAFDYLRKESLPFNLKPVVDAALTAQAEMRSATAFKPQLTVEQYQDSLVGKSQPMQQVFKMIGRVSHSDAPVMITGESGSGKELVPSDPSLQQSKYSAFHRNQLRCNPGKLVGKRAFRTRKRSFYRRVFSENWAL